LIDQRLSVILCTFHIALGLLLNPHSSKSVYTVQFILFHGISLIMLLLNQLDVMSDLLYSPAPATSVALFLF